MAKTNEFDLTPITSIAHVRCSCCGTRFEKYRGNFPPIFGDLYQTTGYLPICNKCAEIIYKRYFAESGDEKAAVRQFCRKLDLYWSEPIYDKAMHISGDKTVISKYLTKLKALKRDVKTYDDTLSEEGKLWDFMRTESFDDSSNNSPSQPEENAAELPQEPEEDSQPIPKEWIRFWGSGQTRAEYEWLEDRYQYYLSRLNTDNIDVGKELLIKQLCNLESEINRGKAEGKSVEKSISGLNNLLGSLEWKPSQLKDDDNYDKNPLGVWIKKFEDKRPLPEVDPELEDVDHIIHYVSTFFMGHLAKMVGLKNRYSKMYDDEMKKYTINPPEMDDDFDDDITFSEMFEDWQED